uniref:Uncharacterized protein n=1 Tax=Noccaea caerulescens TaxID=107243 RepID=A0A1J3GA73_NOCCA
MENQRKKKNDIEKETRMQVGRWDQNKTFCITSSVMYSLLHYRIKQRKGANLWCKQSFTMFKQTGILEFVFH